MSETPITDAAVVYMPTGPDGEPQPYVPVNVSADLEREAKDAASLRKKYADAMMQLEHSRYLDKLKALLPEAATTWIPVSERLPDVIGNYLVINADGLRTIAWAFFNSVGQWCGYNTYYKNVTHWRPLPEPPPQRSTPE